MFAACKPNTGDKSADTHVCIGGIPAARLMRNIEAERLTCVHE